MKKWKIPFLCVLLLLLIAFIGLLNRQIGPKPSSVSSEPGLLQQTSEIPALDAYSATEPQPTAGETTPADGARIIRNYPEYQIKIDAQCPSVTDAREFPCLFARISETYFHNMVQDFLIARYPGAKRIYENDRVCSAEWMAYGPESELMASMAQFKVKVGQEDEYPEGGRISFLDRKLDFNGSYPLFECFLYNYFVDEAALDEAFGAFSPSAAMENAIQMLEPYTDFDLTIYNVVEHIEKSAGNYGYRMEIAPSYLGTPVSNFGKTVHGKNLGSFGLYVCIRENGIGTMQGVFHFEQIEEKEPCQVMSLGDILTAFEKQAPTLMIGSPDPSLEVYYIQLEYFPQLENDLGEYTFRPVWTFYGIHAKNHPCEFMFYADTGELCWR